MSKENKQKDWRPIWLYLLITIGVSIISGFVFGIMRINYDEASLGAIATVASDIVLAIIFTILYHKRLKEDIKKINKKQLIYIIVGAIVLIVINEAISRLFIKLNVEMGNQDTIISYLGALKIPMLMSIVIMAPFIEEIIFRYSVRTLCKNKIVYIIISSISFGLVHGIGIATLLYIFIGACLAIFYLKNDENIVVPISVHLLNNLVAAIEVLLLI